ncbi:insulinase family protein [bacterium]|nr:insulinase family protein [bacterium]
MRISALYFRLAGAETRHKTGGTMKKAGVLAAVLLLMAVAAQAEKGQLNPELLNVQEYRLDNGLQLLMLEDHSAPIVSYQVWYHVGSRHEKPGITGMAHFFEHMMFRGSKKYKPEEHSKIVKAHGGSLNANTWYDRTMYFENISSDQLELVVHLEAERQANLTITPETFEPERQIVREERLMRVDNSLFGSAQEQLITNMFRAHPYNWPVIGWMSDIENYTQEQLRWFHKTYYSPNNCTVVLVGDFDPDEAIALHEKYYGHLPSQEIPPEPKTQEPPHQGERRVYFERPAQLPFVLAGYHIPAARHKDMPAIEVAQKILSDGESSRIYRTCVYERQLAPFAGGFVYDLYAPGLFFAYIGVNPGTEIDTAEAALFDVIETLGLEGPTEQELQKAKNQIEADYIFGLTSVAGKGMAIGETLIKHDGDYEEFLKWPEKVREVTIDDVKRVVQTYLVQRNRTTLILVPNEDAKPVNVSMEGGAE